MTSIAFLGLGNMGRPMARNLLAAGYTVQGFDIVPAMRAAAAADGLWVAETLAAALAGAESIITMVPAGEQARAVYLGEAGVIAQVAAGSLLVDCSTIDVATARTLHAAAAARQLSMVDAPVSGGTAGAAAATLTFMVGGTEAAYARAAPILQAMGKAVIHAGGPGNGQVAKICNNMLLAISMIGTAEAFVLAERLGLSAETFFAIASKSSGQCWAMTSYCPVPGPVPASPANRDYAPGFTVANMLKDLRLARAAAAEADLVSPLGSEAASLYARFAEAGQAQLDFSAIIRMLGAQRT